MTPLIVHRLEMVCVSDDTPDSYGQPGFSLIRAYIFKSDKAAFDEVRASVDTKKNIAVRCGGLEVRGVVNESRRILHENDLAERVMIMVETVCPHGALTGITPAHVGKQSRK